LGWLSIYLTSNRERRRISGVCIATEQRSPIATDFISFLPWLRTFLQGTLSRDEIGFEMRDDFLKLH
jgi:hypothetical protein